jgi:hypothetical protein
VIDAAVFWMPLKSNASEKPAKNQLKKTEKIPLTSRT